MYSEQFMHYLYSYNMPKKEDEKAYTPDNDTKCSTKKHLNVFKNAYATIPLEFNHK